MNYRLLAEKVPWRNGVTIASVDGFGLVAIDKPAGVLSHPNKKAEMKKALLGAEGYDGEDRSYRLDGDVKRIYLLNRLDSATSGILLLALNKDVRDAVLKEFELKRVRKVYEALVFGALGKGGAIWRDRLSKERKEGGVRAAVGGGSEAETKLLSAKAIPGVPLMSRLSLMPLTGRTHQLRIQASKRRVPIVGDRTYGDFNKNKLIGSKQGIRRLCLHCSETQLTYEAKGRKVTFSASSRCSF